MRSRTRWPIALALVAVGASGCMYRVPVSPERLQDVMRLGDGESVVLESDGEEIVVRPDDDPSLWVERAPPCSILGEAFAQDRCGPLKVPIGHARLEGDELHLDAYEGSVWRGARAFEAMTLRAEDVHSLALEYDPPDRVHFGVSLVVLGPSRLGGFQFQVLPAQWLALEVGLFGVADAAAYVWSGLRVRPVEWGSSRPFLGAFVNMGVSSGPRDTSVADEIAWLHYREVSYGPRLGLDIDVTRWFLLTLEVDGIRVEDAGGDVRSQLAGTWSATGGFAISTLF